MSLCNLGNGYVVLDWMTSRLGLSNAETVVYACLYDASMGGERPAVFTPVEAATLCGITPGTVRETVKKLNRLGFFRSVKKTNRKWMVEIDTEVLKRNHIDTGRKSNGQIYGR